MESNSPPTTVDELVRHLSSPVPEVRRDAWQGAGRFSAPAVARVMPLLDDPDPEVARAARRALIAIAHLAGRPDADAEARSVEAALLGSFADLAGSQARRNAIGVLSEIGTSATVRLLSALLGDPEVREDARCALIRIPGPESLAALRNAHDAATGEFRDALAEALHHRGADVPGFQSPKLKPTKLTPVGSSPA